MDETLIEHDAPTHRVLVLGLCILCSIVLGIAVFHAALIIEADAIGLYQRWFHTARRLFP